MAERVYQRTCSNVQTVHLWGLLYHHATTRNLFFSRLEDIRQVDGSDEEDDYPAVPNAPVDPPPRVRVVHNYPVVYWVYYYLVTTFSLICTVLRLLLALVGYKLACELVKIIVDYGFAKCPASVEVDCLRGGPYNLCLLGHQQGSAGNEHWGRERAASCGLRVSSDCGRHQSLGFCGRAGW